MERQGNAYTLCLKEEGRCFSEDVIPGWRFMWHLQEPPVLEKKTLWRTVLARSSLYFWWHQDLSLVLVFTSASLLPKHLPVLAAEVMA